MISLTSGDEGRRINCWFREEDGWNCEEGTFIDWSGNIAIVNFPIGHPVKVRLKDLQWVTTKKSEEKLMTDRPENSRLDQGVFRNAIAILNSADFDEFQKAGIMLTPTDWDRFTDDPLGFVLKLDEIGLNALWSLIEARQPDQQQYKRAA